MNKTTLILAAFVLGGLLAGVALSGWIDAKSSANTPAA